MSELNPREQKLFHTTMAAAKAMGILSSMWASARYDAINALSFDEFSRIAHTLNSMMDEGCSHEKIVEEFKSYDM